MRGNHRNGLTVFKNLTAVDVNVIPENGIFLLLDDITGTTFTFYELLTSLNTTATMTLGDFLSNFPNDYKILNTSTEIKTWQTSILFPKNNILIDPTTSEAYLVLAPYTSGTTIQDDILNGDLRSLGSIERGGILWSEDINYKVGDTVTLKNQLYCALNDHFSALLDVPDGDPEQPTQINWQLVSSIERGGVAWKPDIDYKIGDLITHNGFTYVSAVDHMSEVGDLPNGDPFQPSQISWVKSDPQIPGIFSFSYRWANIVNTTPIKNNMAPDVLSDPAITNLYFNKFGSNYDLSKFFEDMNTGDDLEIYKSTHSNVYKQFKVAGKPSLSGDIYTLPVIHKLSVGSFVNTGLFGNQTIFGSIGNLSNNGLFGVGGAVDVDIIWKEAGTHEQLRGTPVKDPIELSSLDAKDFEIRQILGDPLAVPPTKDEEYVFKVDPNFTNMSPDDIKDDFNTGYWIKQNADCGFKVDYQRLTADTKNIVIPFTAKNILVFRKGMLQFPDTYQIDSSGMSINTLGEKAHTEFITVEITGCCSGIRNIQKRIAIESHEQECGVDLGLYPLVFVDGLLLMDDEWTKSSPSTIDFGVGNELLVKQQFAVLY